MLITFKLTFTSRLTVDQMKMIIRTTTEMYSLTEISTNFLYAVYLIIYW
jgi:hypothetical protein